MKFKIITDSEDDINEYGAGNVGLVVVSDGKAGRLMYEQEYLYTLFDADAKTRADVGLEHLEAVFEKPENRAQLREPKSKAVVVTGQMVTEPVLSAEANPHEVGYFGNIWVRKIYFPTKDVEYQGHTHDHDHVSLLLSGSVRVEVPNHPPKVFTAPTYIVIRAEYEHKIIALEDQTLWWCLHARRDEKNEVVEVYGAENDPLAV